MADLAPVRRLRSLLFAPAVRPELLAKMPATGADGVVIDLEDATPPDAKDQGRANVAAVAPGLIASGVAVFVRINGVDSPWFADDVEHGLVDGLAGVVVPKVDTIAQLDMVTSGLAANGRPQLGVLAGIETCLGVADARSVLGHEVVIAAYFGAEDYIADLGGVRTAANTEVLYARSQVALASRLAGVPALDQIVADYRDDDRFRSEAAVARSLGFLGKLCIHPGQVALANEAFVPSGAEIERAQQLIAAYEAGVADGVAAVSFEGQMVDGPLVAQARNLLAAADD